MQLVIDIDEEDYNRIKDIPDTFNSLTSRAYKSIKNGTQIYITDYEVFVSANPPSEEIDNWCAKKMRKILCDYYSNRILEDKENS